MEVALPGGQTDAPTPPPSLTPTFSKILWSADGSGENETSLPKTH